MEDIIYGINGPVVTVKNTRTFSMMEMVHVGTQKLVGEVIGINDKMTTIQVYEETTGLKPGDPVTGTGAPMNVLLGPGIIDNIFDGIERPLKAIEEISGSFIARGAAGSRPPVSCNGSFDLDDDLLFRLHGCRLHHGTDRPRDFSGFADDLAHISRSHGKLDNDRIFPFRLFDGDLVRMIYQGFGDDFYKLLHRPAPDYFVIPAIARSFATRSVG